MATTSDIKKGVYIMFKGEPHTVVDFQHVSPGKGSGFTRTRLKNLKTGKVLDNTYKSGEGIEVPTIERSKAQYLYGGGGEYTFMDQNSYEQVILKDDILGDEAKYLMEGMEVGLVLHDGITINIDLPKKVTLKVTEASDAVKGDTASGNVTKEVVCENGLHAQVPMFIKEGDVIVINTETGAYVERAN